jgi:hypothetical protein
MLEGRLELMLVQFSVVVVVYGLEQQVKLSFSCLDKDSELCFRRDRQSLRVIDG